MFSVSRVESDVPGHLFFLHNMKSFRKMLTEGNNPENPTLDDRSQTSFCLFSVLTYDLKNNKTAVISERIFLEIHEVWNIWCQVVDGSSTTWHLLTTSHLIIKKTLENHQINRCFQTLFWKTNLVFVDSSLLHLTAAWWDCGASINQQSIGISWYLPCE